MKMDTQRINLELNIAGVASHILSKSISLHGHASLFLLHSKKKQEKEAGPSYNGEKPA